MTHVLARTEAKSLKGTEPKSPWQGQVLGTCVEHSYQDDLRIPVQRQRERWPEVPRGDRELVVERGRTFHGTQLSFLSLNHHVTTLWVGDIPKVAGKLQASQVLFRRSPHMWLSCTMQSHSGLALFGLSVSVVSHFVLKPTSRRSLENANVFSGAGFTVEEIRKIKE